ncbi:hypothetical protein KAW65_07300, partial [candidate division WOR-3 bacterium]|nr:hypothetical protein [candidate division WOR-3 bacterium]
MSSNIFKIGMGVIIMLLGLSFQVKGSDSTIYLGDGHYKAILSTQPLDSTKANWRGSVEYYYATWDSTYKYDSDTRVLCGRNDSEYPGKLEEKFRGFLEYNISSIRNDATIDSVFLWFSGVMVGDFIIYDITSMSIRPFGAWNYEIWDEIGSAYAYIYGDSLDYSDLPRTLKLEDAECDLETHLPDTLNWFALGLMSCMEEEDGHLLHAISDTLMVYYTIPQIPPAITLNWPNESGLVLDVGQEYQVKWSAEDDNYVKYVDGWLSLDWGNTFPIYLGTQKNEYYTNPWDSSLVWIPSADQMTEQGRVMVIAYDVQDLADTAISYYDIKVTDISPPWDSVISPDGGEDLACESWQEIEWVATDNVWVDSVNIYLSLDGGITYPDTIAHSEPNDSSYSWKVPNTPSTSCRIKIIAFDPGSNSAVDISNADFTISDKTPPQVMGVWIEDEGAEVNRIEVDEDCKIKIDASDNVLVDKIDVYIDGVYFTTIDVQAESGIFSCDWVSPSSPTTVSIRAVAYDKADNSDEGITSISICWLTSDLAGATFPNSQKKLAIDETSNIHFLFSDANDNNIVRYAKSIDNGTTWPTQYKQIIGQGNFPVIALDDLDGVDKVNVCWLKGGGFYYTLWYSRDFGIPEQVPSPISGDAEFFPPVIVVDGNSLVHLALETWGYDDTKKAYIWALRYGTFPVGNPADISWEPPLDSYEVSGPPPPSP